MNRRPLLPWIVLAASLLLTAVAALALARSTRERDDEVFRNAVQSTQDRIRARMDTYRALVRGAAAYITAEGDGVSDEHFGLFVARLRLSTFYTGIRAIGYTRRLESPAEAAALVATRRRTTPEYHLWPDSVGPERHAIVSLYPLDPRNRIALGYDMHSEPTRGAAMDRARDIGGAMLTGRVRLVQESERSMRPGFLLYVPVFRSREGPIPRSLAARRASLIGYAYAGFRSREVMRGIFGTEDQPRTAFRIYDGPRADTSALLYDSADDQIAPAARPLRTTTAQMPIAGRTWTIAFASTDSFASTREDTVPFVLAGGVALSLLLFGLTGAQGRAARLTIQSERRFRVLLESMPVAVTVADAQGRITFRNARAEAMRTSGTLYHHETHVVVESYHLPLARALEGTRVEGEVYDLADEQAVRRTILSSAFPVLAADGTLQMAVEAVVDVTDQKRAEERASQLRRHAQELERSNRELQEFAYVASHDLQEPLRKISAFSDLLRSDHSAALDDEGIGFLNRIQESALRMSSLIKDLLTFSRVTTQTRPFTEVPLARVLDEVTQDLWARLTETQGRVDAVALPTVRADATQMRQLFQNLLGNALKFHRPGIPPVVTIRAERTRITAPDGLEGLDGWRLTIQDNGIGFDEKYRDRIFAPFQRLHTRGEYDGTGIGLAICRRIVERHGGTIHVSSTPGEGSTFVVELPTAPPVVTPPPAAAFGLEDTGSAEAA